MKFLLRYPFLTFLLLPFFAQTQNLNLDAEMQKAFESLQPVGLSVAVVQDGKIVYKNALGYKNAEQKTALDTRSLFNIASCSKAFTAAAVGILVEEGKIQWDDKVTQYIPELQLSDPYITRELTITDLLCHRSGLATFDGDLLWYATDYTDEQIIQHMQYLPIDQAFRSDFGYQNLMFMLAGKVVERVSGQSWSDFVQTRFFTPLNMRDTRPSNDELTEYDNLSTGHIHGLPIPRYDFNGVKPAASMYSSVEDLANWAGMLLNKGNFEGKKILAESTIDQLFTPNALIPLSGSRKRMGIHFYAYGMGWFLSDYQGVKVIEHDGGMPGYISKVCLVPELNLAFISLNNGEEPLINDALKWTAIDRALRNSGRQIPETDWIAQAADRKKMYLEYQKREEKARIDARIPNTKPGVSMDKLVGEYNDPSYGKARVEMRDGKPYLVLAPAAKNLYGSMEHWHFDTYKVQFPDAFLPFALITFNFDAEHNVSGFKIDCPIPDFHFYKLDFKRI